jgi:hypothetical protein
MKYMLLMYASEVVWTDSEREACFVESAHIAHQLTIRGQYLEANPLHSVATATSVQVRNGKRLLTDGPFAETREQLCGYVLVEAHNLDDAIELAGQLPNASHGTVEIRPILERAAVA